MRNEPQFTIIDDIKCFSPETANAYDDYPDSGFDVTDSGGDSSFWVRSRNRLFKKIVEDHLVQGRQTKLLEIGCGTGCFIQQIKQNTNLDITGSEVYLKGLRYAKKNIPSVNFVQFDITKGGIGDEFDIIIAFDVIEHIEDDVTAISNVHKMLPSNGCFIVTVPQHQFLWSSLDEIVKHKRRYSRNDLVSKLEKNGFEIVKCTSFLFLLFPLMLVSRLLDKKRDSKETDEVALQQRVSFPGFVNKIFDFFMRIDELLIRLGFSLPFGGTLVVVARKK